MTDAFRKEVANFLVKAIGKKEFGGERVDALIEKPQKEFGDYAFPCFALAKEFKKSPQLIAQDLAAKINPAKSITEIKAVGPYVNFFVNDEKIASATITDILKEKGGYGKGDAAKSIMVEYFHANTHKAVHIGHIRNICLGEALCRILEHAGNKVIRVNYQGDIGPHVAKCLWKLQKSGAKLPKSNRLRFLGDVYMKANIEIKGSEKFEAESRELLAKLYAGDPALEKLWKETRQACLNEFEEMYRDFGVKYKEFYFESDMERDARKISEKLVKDGIAERNEGAIVVDLKKFTLGIYVLLTREGTALYSSKDIVLAGKKMSKYRLDKSIHVVGKEQELHFKQLFKTLSLMGGPEKTFAEKSYHLIYGLVMLPEGKMSSREGNVIFYDELRKGLLSVAGKEVKRRHSGWSAEKIGETARKIAFAALKFGMINRDNENILIFDWQKALSLEGETGPYIQYACARINSIEKKYGKKLPSKANVARLITNQEQALVRMLSEFPGTVEAAACHYKPLLIARYLLDLAKAFNNFYHQDPILSAEEDTKQARLLLINAVRQVLENGLALLGIEAPEKM